MSFPNKVKIVEVGPRDGLQNEATILATDVKMKFINQLSETGLSHIEVSSFVSPKWIPQLADHKEIFQVINQKQGVHYSALVPNLRGLETALSAGVKNIAVFTTPSQQFSQKNIHCSVEESLRQIADITQLAQQHRLTIRGYISCALGCPYEGEIAPKKVAEMALALINMGCTEISLSDTIGRGTPLQVQQLLHAVSSVVSMTILAVHFHDTFGQALANIYAALEQGISTVDSSVAGLGGCPYAKGATGNVATEDVVYMLDGMGIETGVNLKQLVMAGRYIAMQLGKPPLSKTNIAMNIAS
jgi:isopropylmalate/homocitrate/citramalate synthase